MISHVRVRAFHEWKVRQLAFREYARRESARPFMRQRGFIINPYAFGAGATDPNFANVVSLVHFNDANGFNGPFVDQIANRSPGWTNISTPANSTQTTFVKYGACGLACTTGVYNADHADWNFGSGDYTCEGWFYYTGAAAFGICFAQWHSTSGNKAPFLAYFNSSRQPVFGASTTNASWDFLQTSATVASTSTWYHVAQCRSGTTVRGFLAGTECVTAGTLTGSVVNNTDNVTIGNTTNNPGTLTWPGYIDECRFTNMARYTGNFTPSATQFPDS